MIRRLCIGIMALAAIEFVIATPGVQIRNLPQSTDFATYYLAGALTREGASPYDRGALAARGHALGFDYDQFPFLYPPPFALAMQPLASLAYPRARQAWMLVTTAALLAALAMMVRLVRAHAATVVLPSADVVWMILAAFFASALNSTSVHNDIRAGSVGAMLLLSAATIAWAMLAERPARLRDLAVAVALGAATLVKLVPAVWIVWVAWRRRRRAALWALALLTLTMVPAIAHWGPSIVPTYVRDALLPSAGADVAPPMNQSLDAALSRLFVSSVWVEAPFDAPAVARLLSVLATLAVIGFTASVLWRRRHARDVFLYPIEFGYVVLAMLLVMKLTWVQTLCAMLFVWPALMVVLAAALARDVPWARRAVWWACIGYFLSSAHVPILWAGLRHGPAVAVTAVHTVGLLVLWMVAGAVLRRAAALQGCAATTARGELPAGIKL